jgi:hypothetical protein
MAEILKRITIEGNGRNWYLHLNHPDDLVKSP